MKGKLIPLFAALALAALPALALCEVSVTDMTGREIALDAPAARIVALTPSDCEILCALGAEETIVGRGEYCDYPASLADVPVVASGSETNVEQIIALDPQAVVMAKMAQTPEQVEALESAGIRTAVSDAQDIAGVYEAIRLLGALTGRETEAEALENDMREKFTAVSETSGETGKTVYFEVSPLEYGLWTAGANTFMDEVAAMCGLKNAFSDLDGWSAVSEEQVLERDPDYIVTITMYSGEGPTPEEEIAARENWQALKAVKNGAILRLDNDEISRPGPRLTNAAEALCEFVTGGEADAPAA